MPKLSLQCPRAALAIVLPCLMSAAVFGATQVPTYGTYFGGAGDETGVSVAIDGSGNIVVAGTTTSSDLKGTASRLQPNLAPGPPGHSNGFIAKFDPTGQNLIWATYLGGNGNDSVRALAIDSSNNIYVIGQLSSTNFPFTPGAFGNSGQSFAAKLSSDGTRLIYSTALPLTPVAATVDPAGELCIVGNGTFNTKGALSVILPPSLPFESPVNLIKLNTTGSQMVFGALLGSGGSSPTSIAFDPQGNIYVAGFSTGGILTTSTSLQPTYSNGGLSSLGGGLNNGFLVETDPTASRLLYGTYFGPIYDNTVITKVVVGSNGSVYLGGSTNASSYSASAGALQTTPGGGFIAALGPGGSAIQAFSYLPSDLVAMVLARDGSSLSCIVRVSLSATFGTQPYTIFKEFFQVSTTGLTLLGQTHLFDATDLALDTNDNAWLIGTTYNTSNYGGFFVTPNALQKSLDGSSDAFLEAITSISPRVITVVNSATGSSPFAAGQLISIYGSQLGPNSGSTLQIGSDKTVASSNAGTKVMFDGVAAPILYTSASQVNVAIPCVVAGHSSTQVLVNYLGATSAPVTLALSAAAPGIFTADGSGKGQAAVLNQDFTLNGSTNPALRGSAVTFYATGIGPTSPCVDGATYQSNFPAATQTVVAGVGNVGAQVLYAGQAPFFVSGVAQINITIPSDAPTGVVPLTLVVGGVFSPQGVTIAVK